MFILGGDSADIGTPNGTCTINLSTRRQPSAPSLEELNVQVRFTPLSLSLSLSLPLSLSLFLSVSPSLFLSHTLFLSLSLSLSLSLLEAIPPNLR